MNILKKIIEKRFKLYISLTFIFLILLAWANRFIQDDTFISFRYAENFVKGFGLVFNKGVRLEGYTNFLWTIIIALPIKFNLNPINFVYYSGIVFFIITLFFTYKLSFRILESKTLAFITLILLGTNYTMSCYATGGLETQMQTAIITACYFLFFRFILETNREIKNLYYLSILSAVSILTRPDSIIFAVIIFSAIVFIGKKEKLSKVTIFKNILTLLIPFLIILIPYLVWKLNYYGNILPNTYYVKAGSQTSIVSGLKYVGWFLTSYWLIIFPIILLVLLKEFLNEVNLKISLLLITILVWTLYLIKIGGGFMEFRFFVPILPFIFIVIVWIINKLIQPEKLKVVFLVIIITGSIFHAVTFHYNSGIEGIRVLESHLTNPNQNWIGVGKKLKTIFGGSDVEIAVTAAGAVPYYSELKTLDMLGLNDKYIAREQNIISNRPGHQKLASIDYLKRKGVNLLIGDPFVASKSFKISEISNLIFKEHFMYDINDFKKISPRILIEELDNKHNLIMLYLNENNYIENAISKKKLESIPYSEIINNG